MSRMLIKIINKKLKYYKYFINLSMVYKKLFWGYYMNLKNKMNIANIGIINAYDIHSEQLENTLGYKGG
jgi:hypothetical protein